MIVCKFKVLKGFYEAFEISGHALYAKKGKDIVCAAVSTVSQHTARALSEDGAQLEIEEGYLKVEKIPKDNNLAKIRRRLRKTLGRYRKSVSKIRQSGGER